MWQMTDEEIRRGDERRRALYASGDPEDNITAILMHSAVGQIGLREDNAREKAKMILLKLKGGK